MFAPGRGVPAGKNLGKSRSSYRDWQIGRLTMVCLTQMQRFVEHAEQSIGGYCQCFPSFGQS